MSEGNGTLRAEHEALRAKQQSFEEHVLDELKHLREQDKRHGEALDELLRLARRQEARDEAEHE